MLNLLIGFLVALSFASAFYSGVMAEKQKDGWGGVLLVLAFACMGAAAILQRAFLG